MERLKNLSRSNRLLSRSDMEIEMTDFVADMIKTMHLFKNKEMFVDRNITKRTAQIGIKYDRPTHFELRPILSIELHDSDLSLSFYSLESLNLNKEQELEVLRGLNYIAEALKKKLDYINQGPLKGSVSLTTDLGQVLKEAEDELVCEKR